MRPIIQFVKKFWFSSEKPNNATQNTNYNGTILAPGTQILHDPQLISRLKEDHAQLIQIFNKLIVAIKQKKSNEARVHLDAFKNLFNAHALTEYTKLYIFLDYAFRNDPEHHDLIILFRKEMHDIGRAIRAFYVKWNSRDSAALSSDLFLKEVGIVGRILVERIETEETRLYEIYDMAPSLLELGQNFKTPN